MTTSISVKPKKRGRGRPATGRDPIIGLRLPKEETARLDKWAKANGYTRSEAIRVMIDRVMGDPSQPAYAFKAALTARDKLPDSDPARAGPHARQRRAGRQ
jgi:predicted DNA-binding protein